MTSNQVSYAIGSANVEESKRHNMASEELENQRLQIEANKAENQNQWEKERNRLQSEYNTAYLNYQNASLDWKSHYENEMLKIQQQLANVETLYKKDQTEINQKLADFKGQLTEEEIRHNYMLEQFQSRENYLRSKDLEYKESAAILDASVRQLDINTRLLLERERESNKLAITNTEAKLKELELRIQQENAQTNRLKLWVDGITNAVKTGVSVGSALLLGGK